MSGGRRRLLVLCYFYPPLAGGGVHRVLSFTRWLPQHGWDCTVVCAGSGDYWVEDEVLTKAIPPATEVVRVRGGSAIAAWLKLRGGAGRRSGRTFARLRRAADWWLLPDSYVGWSRRAAVVALARARAGGIDAILSSSPPDSVHLAAAGVARAARLPWVADFRDPWIGLHLRKPPTAWHAARQQALERRVLAGASLVTAASRTHADRLAGRTRAVLHLPNGFEPEPAAPATAVGDDGRFTMVFTGTLSQMEDARVFLAALAEVLAARPQRRGEVRVVIAGPHDVDDRAFADRLGLGDVVAFPGPVSHAASRALQRRADLLLLWKPRGFDTMVPGKLYEYLDAGRPLLAILDPADESAALARAGGATVVASGDRAAIARVVGEAFDAWRERGGARAPDRRPDWLAMHERRALAARLAAALDALPS